MNTALLVFILLKEMFKNVDYQSVDKIKIINQKFIKQLLGNGTQAGPMELKRQNFYLDPRTSDFSMNIPVYLGFSMPECWHYPTMHPPPLLLLP